MPSIQALLEQINAEVAALPAPAVAELAPIMLEAQRELQRDLAEWLARHPVDGAQRFTAQHYRGLLVQINGVLRRLRAKSPEVAALLTHHGLRAKELSLGHIRLELEQFGAKFGGAVNPLPIRPASHFIGPQAQARSLITRFRNSAMRYTDAVANDIRRQLALGMVRGETFDQLTNRLRRLGGPRGRVLIRGPRVKGGLPYWEDIPEGLFRRYRHWAERLARTEVINAYNVEADIAIVDASKYDSGLMRRWNAALDGRVCLECRRLDGEIVPIGSNFSGGVPAPPLHPNCRCAVVAWRMDWA
jgi:SPP1 gp7 family putative phage head morphogenesis protein